MKKPKTKLLDIWALGLGLMLALYFAGNPFWVYDDVVIIGGLAVYTWVSRSL